MSRWLEWCLINACEQAGRQPAGAAHLPRSEGGVARVLCHPPTCPCRPAYPPCAPICWVQKQLGAAGDVGFKQAMQQKWVAIDKSGGEVR